jgi:hypothetical protein
MGRCTSKKLTQTVGSTTCLSDKPSQGSSAIRYSSQAWSVMIIAGPFFCLLALRSDKHREATKDGRSRLESDRFAGSGDKDLDCGCVV